jgi:hypothetical protein
VLMSERSILASISEELLTAQFPLRKGVFHFSPKPLEARAGLRSAPHQIGGVREAHGHSHSVPRTVSSRCRKCARLKVENIEQVHTRPELQ